MARARTPIPELNQPHIASSASLWSFCQAARKERPWVLQCQWGSCCALVPHPPSQSREMPSNPTTAAPLPSCPRWEPARPDGWQQATRGLASAHCLGRLRLGRRGHQRRRRRRRDLHKWLSSTSKTSYTACSCASTSRSCAEDKMHAVEGNTRSCMAASTVETDGAHQIARHRLPMPPSRRGHHHQSRRHDHPRHCRQCRQKRHIHCRLRHR